MGALLEGEPDKYMAGGVLAPEGSHVMQTRWQKEGRRHKTHLESQGKCVEPLQPPGSKDSLECRRTLLGSLSVKVIPTRNKNCKRIAKEQSSCAPGCAKLSVKKKSQCKIDGIIYTVTAVAVLAIYLYFINESLSLNSVFCMLGKPNTSQGKNFRPITCNFIQTCSEDCFFWYPWVKGAK